MPLNKEPKQILEFVKLVIITLFISLPIHVSPLNQMPCQQGLECTGLTVKSH